MSRKFSSELIQHNNKRIIISLLIIRELCENSLMNLIVWFKKSEARGDFMFSQSPFQCRIEWGQRGARESAERGDITIIVDVLSFSSTVVTALQYGAIIFPHPNNAAAKGYATNLNAKLIIGRAEASRQGAATLSPVSFNSTNLGEKLVLCSLNGAICTWIAAQVPALLIGSLLNASSVAAIANQIQLATGANITVVPCGEQWEGIIHEENKLRPSIEDYLGAGAILSELNGTKSPEAKVCINAFQHSEEILSELIWDCGSGRELRERGFENDVLHCARLNVLNTVPLLKALYFVDAYLEGLGEK
jgi:2-phosphosulfolactate phosphatase